MIEGLPYDCEIEYLESTGTQWIDTEANTSPNGRIESKLQKTGNVGQNIGIWGCGGAYTGCLYSIRFPTQTNEVIIYPYASQNNTAQFSILVDTTLAHDYVIDQTEKYASVDGIKSYFSSSASGTLYRIYLFAYGRLGVADPSLSFVGKCYNTRIYDNSTLVRDLIPVRVGQTGYMYDRVSRKLFGNKGTGAFVLGPDVAKPVMGLYGMRKVALPVDYVQNGLVGLWDGTENAGFGQHSSSGNIVDLTGNGYDLVLTGSDSRGSDYFALDTKGFYTVTDGSKIISAFDAGCLECEIVAAGNNGECMLSFFGSNTSGFMVRPWFYTVSSTNNRYGTRGTVGTVTKDSGFYSQPNSYVGRIVRHATRFSAPNFTVECNLTAKATGTISTYTRENSNMILGARASYTGVNRWSGRYYNVRLYNRALSAAEIAHNYQIDKARFNLQ